MFRLSSRCDRLCFDCHWSDAVAFIDLKLQLELFSFVCWLEIEFWNVGASAIIVIQIDSFWYCVSLTVESWSLLLVFADYSFESDAKYSTITRYPIVWRWHEFNCDFLDRIQFHRSLIHSIESVAYGALQSNRNSQSNTPNWISSMTMIGSMTTSTLISHHNQKKRKTNRMN